MKNNEWQRFLTRAFIAMFLVTALGGCMTAAEHRAAVQGEGGDRLAVGKVQREIRVGMSGADVVQVLGSPNIVSTDEQRREVWIYDKISTEHAYSTSRGGVAALVLATGSVLGAAVPSYGSSSGASSTSQRTLTVIVKFGGDAKVRDFAYHTSRF